MFFYKYKVEEYHINKYTFQLYEWYLEGKTRLVLNHSKKCHVHKIFDKENKEWIYFIIDASFDAAQSKHPQSKPHPAIIGLCALVKQPKWRAFETILLYVSPKSRGKGIATFLYDSIMKDGIIVISGYSHNLKSQKLWMKIVRNKNYTSWVHDINNLTNYCPVYVEDNKFECNLKLYEDIKNIRRKRQQDIRIIAFNPRYVT